MSTERFEARALAAGSALRAAFMQNARPGSRPADAYEGGSFMSTATPTTLVQPPSPTTPRRRRPSAWVAAAALVVAAGTGGAIVLTADDDAGDRLLPAGPSPALIARGNFVTFRGVISSPSASTVELEATGEGSNVTGQMTVTEAGTDTAFTVDLQCTRTTEDGVIMIGGVTTATAGEGSAQSPEGSWAAIALKRGSPVQATVWAQRGGGTSVTSCLAYLDERFIEKLSDPSVDSDDPSPIEGTVEFGP